MDKRINRIDKRKRFYQTLSEPKEYHVYDTISKFVIENYTSAVFHQIGINGDCEFEILSPYIKPRYEADIIVKTKNLAQNIHYIIEVYHYYDPKAFDKLVGEYQGYKKQIEKTNKNDIVICLIFFKDRSIVPDPDVNQKYIDKFIINIHYFEDFLNVDNPDPSIFLLALTARRHNFENDVEALNCMYDILLNTEKLVTDSGILEHCMRLICYRYNITMRETMNRLSQDKVLKLIEKDIFYREIEAIGVEKGEAMGEARGKAEGKAEGEAIGEAIGIARGKTETQRQNIINMYFVLNIDCNEIARLLFLDKEYVQTVVNEYKPNLN